MVVLVVLGFAGNAVSKSPPVPAAPAEPETQIPLAFPASIISVEPPEPSPSPSPEPSPTPSPVDKTMKVGSNGPEVLQLEQRLAELRYLSGKVDGTFDSSTRHGLIAFQKVEGLQRSGVGDAPTLARLAVAGVPAPRFTTPAEHLEVDVARQVVFVVRAGAVSEILPTSTGTNKLFTNGGWTRRAVTPNGVFKISRKINGMRISPLGELYKPSYFNGGIAFHGSPSVPTGPASHGCVRVPMPFATGFFDNASPIGMTVYVHAGPSGENPQPVIDDAPAPLPAIAEEPPASPEPSAADAPAAPTIPAEPLPSPALSPSPTPSPDQAPPDVPAPSPLPTASFPFS
ncbi:MAG: L,D-transpeptidase family protein [Actinomycetota bacterium]